MKKIIAVVSLLGFAAVTAAQEPPTKQLSIQEANQLNGTPKEPTINGKPYSQHKAEQEALRKQQAAKPAAHMANLPKGLSLTPNTETADPALQRMNEQAKQGMPQADDKRTAPPVVDEKFVKNQTTTTAPATEAFKLPNQEQWQAMGMNKPVAAALASNDPSHKQSPSNVVVVDEVKPVTESKMIRTEAATGEKESVTQKPNATFTQATPEVPEQFKLSSNATWGNKPVAENKAIAPSTVQQEGGGVGNGSAEAPNRFVDPSSKQSPSNVVVADAAKPLQESKMLRTGTPKPAPVEASVVKTPAKDAASSPAAPLLPSNLNNPSVRDLPAGNAPATVPAQNSPVAPGSTMGVPAEQNKPATEKPAKQN